jgi:uncharacterized protein YhbP (UPF0306 family)
MSAGTPLDVPAPVLEYLGEQRTLSLATASPNGIPHAATFIYVNDGLTIYVWTRPGTTTAAHLEQNPAVAFTIDHYTADLRETKGIQGLGECQEVLNPTEIQQIIARFAAKYPAGSPGRTGGLSFYRVNPSSIQYIDNEGMSAGAAPTLGSDYRRQSVYSVFRDLPPQEVATIASRLEPVRIGPGVVVVRQGAPADKFFIIVDGEVEVIRENDGVARTVATLKSGQFFGEMAILRDLPRTATVRTTVPTTLLAMDRDAFRALVAQSLATTQDFDRVIQQRLGELGGETAR